MVDVIDKFKRKTTFLLYNGSLFCSCHVSADLVKIFLVNNLDMKQLLLSLCDMQYGKRVAILF